MRTLSSLPFRRQLMLLMALVCAVAFLLASVALLSYEAARSRTEMEQNLHSLAQVVGANSTAALSFADRRAGAENLAALAVKPEVMSAALYTPSGQLLAAYHRPDAPASDSAPESGPPGPVLSERSLLVLEPVLLDGETVGTVSIKAGMEGVSGRLKRYALVLLSVMLACALVGLGLASGVQGVVSRPIMRLAAAAREVAETHDYALRVAVAGPDELRALTTTFNAMLARIQEQDAALRRARDELEERVQDRVRDLRREVQDREQAQAALKSSEEKFRSIVETTRDWICASDSVGRCRYSNPAVASILGFSPTELVGRSLWELVHPEDRPRAFEVFGQCHDTRKGWSGLVVRLQHRDGSWRCLESAGMPILDSSGTVVGFQGTGHDTTEQRMLEEQLRQSQKMEAVGRLAGGVAHDFNNLLGVILGYSELLMKRQLDGPSGAKVEQIRKAAERAAGLTRQLLAFSRKQLLDLKVIDLNTILTDTASMLRRLIGEDVELQLITSPEVARVRVDAGQIEQVLMNLAVNARDAMPTGGRLVLKAALANVDASQAVELAGLAPGPHVTLTVSDTGSGMEPKVLAHAFEPFFTTKEKGRGTGLGLATVYGIVKQSGGCVTVESAPGAGTTFCIYLPRVPAVAEPPAETREPSRTERGSETVLVVEDEAALRTLARQILEANGYSVLEAASGMEALVTAQGYSGPIHLLLTDVVMPGMSGPELAERLRSVRPELAVLFMSGYTDDALGHHGALTPGTLLIQKPFKEERLTRQLREALASVGRHALAGSTLQYTA
jgi:two-component system cell cycle sensor histidine kinase/response regulator CckA